ncbi:2'-5' RNA ligase family protein [Demequina phytophila]|uniref:2'-5' RNA ligase family protein n=1 Tax=Demequina phytophila TaxID=1638981 RepID=UPI000780B090|nr:2'-5' RNA ligase family protein [Demequina phytophila]
MRLFLGVMTPGAVDDVLDAVLDAAVRFRAREAGVDRWTPREERHVTVRFLGETQDRAAVESAAALAAARVRAPRLLIGPLAIALTARVVALPVAGAEPIAAAVDAALAQTGLPARDRPFTGHLTIARSRHRLHGAVAHEALAHRPLAVPWQPDALHVIASEPETDARYRVLSTHPFAP